MKYLICRLGQFLGVGLFVCVPMMTGVEAAPVISSQSTSRQVLAPGQNLSLSVTASGSGTLNYQWYRNNKSIAGATTSTYSKTQVGVTDNGAYAVVVTDSAGNLRSSTMFVLVAPVDARVVAWGHNSNRQATVPAGLTGAVAVAGGLVHSLALKADGSVVAWGSNTNGQTNVPPGLSGVVAVAAGDYHSLALKSDGTVVAWGSNYFKVSGNVFTGQATVPVGLANVVAVAAGSYHSLALKSDGTVVAWGSNISTNIPYNINTGQATVPAGLTNVVAIAGGSTHSLVVKSDGMAEAWGAIFQAIEYVPVAIPADLTNLVAGAGGITHSLLLKADGSMVAWGWNNYGQNSIPDGLADVVGVAAGTYHSIALKADGTVAAWGNNTYGQAVVPAALRNVVAVAAGGNHCLAVVLPSGPAITSHPANQSVVEGRAVVFSASAFGPPAPTYQWQHLPMGSSTWSNLADNAVYSGSTSPSLSVASASMDMAGDQFRCVVGNGIGPDVVSNPASLAVFLISSQSPVRQVLAPGQSLSLAVTASGTGSLSYQWYYDNKPIPGATGSTYQKINLGTGDGGAYTLAVTDSVGTLRATMFALVAAPNGCVVAWGRNNSGQCTIPADLGEVIHVTAGGNHSLALRSDGTVAAWGDTSSGLSSVPAGLTDVVAVSAGYSHSLALKSDGTVVAWGSNLYGQSTVPVGLENVIAVAAGGSHSLALKSDGTVVGWGLNTYQQTTVPEDLRDVAALATGSFHSLAVKSDGSVVGWGRDDSGQCTIPAGLGNVTAVVAEYYHSVALKSDGTVAAWGQPYFGQTSVPAGLNNVLAVATGQYHTLALRSDGSIVSWGTNNYGEATIPSGLADVQAVAAGFNHSLAIRPSHAPEVTAQPASTSVLEGDTARFSVAASGPPDPSCHWQRLAVGSTEWVDLGDDATYSGTATSTLSVASATLYMSGDRFRCILSNGQLPDGVSETATLAVFNISGFGPERRILNPGNSLSLAVTAGGTGTLGYQWYHNNRRITGATGPAFSKASVSFTDRGIYTVVISDSIGSKSISVLVQVVQSGGMLTSWGSNSYGQADVPEGLGDVVGVASGWYHNLALKSDGTVVVWGNDTFDQSQIPANLNEVVSVAAGSYQCYAIKLDGTVVGWGDVLSNQTAVLGTLAHVVALDSGSEHALALKSDGTVMAWGSNSNGQTTVPAGLCNVVAVSTGYVHSLALKSDGTVVAWGGNGNGQVSVPAGLSDVVAIAAGYNNSLALRSDGTVVAWGSGAGSLPSDLANAVAVAGGTNHALAVKQDSTVATWGSNYDGQTDLPAGLGGVVAVSAGFNHSVALSMPVSPIFATNVSDQILVVGENAQFSANAQGAPAPTFRWQRKAAGVGGWSDLVEAGAYSGTGTSTLTVAAITSDMSGDQFRCIAGNGLLPDAISNSAKLTVLWTYEQWVGSFSLGNSSFDGTPQNDGISNGLKYLYNIDPSRPMTAEDRAALPRGQVAGSGGAVQYLTMSYRENASASGVAAVVQTSTDLVNWQTVAPDVVEEIGTDPVTLDPIVLVKVATLGAAKMFIRIVAVQQ